MTKLEAWIAWGEQSHGRTGDDKLTLEMSSHGKAFSYAWDAAIANIIAMNKPEIEKVNAHIKALETDPAIYFCHRFAILLEGMLLTNDVDLDRYWDEAHALLDEYNAARDKWMEAQGQPYASGFGKD